VTAVTRPDGTVFTDCAPVRYWTRPGAYLAAAQRREDADADPLLAGRLTIEVKELGPFREAAYLAALDAEEADGEGPRQ
jgi:hypothetical protein